MYCRSCRHFSEAGESFSKVEKHLDTASDDITGSSSYTFSSFEKNYSIVSLVDAFGVLIIGGDELYTD